MHTRSTSITTRLPLSWLVALLLSSVALPAFAAPWALQQMLTPPAEAGYTPDQNIGFGHEVALSVGSGYVVIYGR